MAATVPQTELRPTLWVGGRRSDGGFTMVEMLIALFILSVSILALTELTLVSIRTNLATDLRNTAVRVTSEKAEELLSLPITSLASGTQVRAVAVRNATVNFTVTWVVTELSNDLRQVVITVEYTNKGATRSNSAVIYKHRAV